MSFRRPDAKALRALREAERDANLRLLVQFARARPQRGIYGGSTVLPSAPAPVKLTRAVKVRQPIRDSARGESCTVRLPWVCNSDPQTTIWSHYPLNDAGKGMGTKGIDVVGCYCCSACHDVVDGRAPRPAGMTRNDVLLAWFKGMVRSIVRLAEKGLI